MASSERTAFDPPLDLGIRKAVEVLFQAGIETFDSCQGGQGHTYPEPTVRFHGDRSEGYRAYAAVLQAGLPVGGLKRVWSVVDDELTGPWWELTFGTELLPTTASQLLPTGLDG